MIHTLSYTVPERADTGRGGSSPAAVPEADLLRCASRIAISLRVSLQEAEAANRAVDDEKKGRKRRVSAAGGSAAKKRKGAQATSATQVRPERGR